jgi:cytidylate kinase
MTVPVLTVDGPGGAGKGSVCRRIADHFAWNLLDSGALYRLVGLAAREQAVDLEDINALASLARHLDVEFVRVSGAELVQPRLAGRMVGPELRAERAGSDASKLAAIPEVRAALLQRQRDFAVFPGLVADGRDMGTVVFPEATLKVFLTASAEERAMRRYKQLMEQGLSANLRALEEEMRDRDRRDQERAVSPLRPASDAWVVDTTDLGLDEVVARIQSRLESRLNARS